MNLFCPDSFRHCVDATTLCRLARDLTGWTAVPLSDGGEGFLDCLPGRHRRHLVPARDADGSPRRCPVLLRHGRAFLAVADIAPLRPVHRLRLRQRSSRGVGEALLSLIHQGEQDIVLALGGSGCHDGGEGAFEVVHREWPADARLTLLADVETRFHDSVDMFAPQKGADAYGRELIRKRFLEIEPGDGPEGGGAAGGLGRALANLSGATLTPGFDWLAAEIGLEEKIRKARVVVTGEGRLDQGTLEGKVVARVADIAGRLGRPCHVICGSWDGRTAPAGVTDVHELDSGIKRRPTLDAVHRVLARIGA